MRIFHPVLAAACMLAATHGAEPPSPSAPVNPPAPLRWDDTTKLIRVKPDQSAATFSFLATNASDATVEIRAIQSVCDCTTVHMPPKPWLVPPRAQVPVAATLEFPGQAGLFIKTLTVETTHGTDTLTMVVEIPGVAPDPKKPAPAPAPLPPP